MSKALLTGPASDPDDGIIDAEFEDVIEDGPDIAKPQPSRAPDYTISEWLIDMHPAKAAVVVAIVIALFIAFVNAVSGSGANNDGSQEIGGATASAETADQMFAEWSRRVTGQPTTTGFQLVDGKGQAGTSCDEGDASHLLQFGQLGKETPILSDWFNMLTAGSDITVGGAFWFNKETNELLVRNAHAADLKHTKDWAVPDKIFHVTGGGDGTVQLDGVPYHFCVLTE